MLLKALEPPSPPSARLSWPRHCYLARAGILDRTAEHGGTAMPSALYLRQTEVRCRTGGREIFRCIRASLKPDNARQGRDAGNLGVAVIGISRLVTAIDPDLVLDPKVVRGHEIVTE